MMVLEKKTILVVEDDQDILYTLQTFLESEGYQMLTAENGLRALEVLKESGLPDLIFLDMKMPIMNGWEFARHFSESYGHGIPVVAMTAAADAKIRAEEAQLTRWIGKPFHLDELLAKVKEYIG